MPRKNVMLQYEIHLRIILKLFQNENNYCHWAV